jgi:hypothetical protein
MARPLLSVENAHDGRPNDTGTTPPARGVHGAHSTLLILHRE